MRHPFPVQGQAYRSIRYRGTRTRHDLAALRSAGMSKTMKDTLSKHDQLERNVLLALARINYIQADKSMSARSRLSRVAGVIDDWRERNEGVSE